MRSATRNFQLIKSDEVNTDSSTSLSPTSTFCFRVTARLSKEGSAMDKFTKLVNICDDDFVIRSSSIKGEG